MDKKMFISHFISAKIVVIILVIFTLFSCRTKKENVIDYSKMSVAQLEKRLYEKHDIYCFTELVTRLCYNNDIDIKKHAHFLTDSLHSIHALTFACETEEECLYYLALNEAYDIDGCYVDLVGIESLKKEIDDYLTPLHYRKQREKATIDSLKKCITENYDTLAYLELRSTICFSKEIKTYAQLLADSMSYLVAIQDMYNIIEVEHYDGYPMDSATFASANVYLERGVERGYLPSIFQKSFLLLMGVYLPQDTIEGKRLLDSCLINPPCETPFWRKPN